MFQIKIDKIKDAVFLKSKTVSNFKVDFFLLQTDLDELCFDSLNIWNDACACLKSVKCQI